MKLLSIIIPTYNMEALLPRCLDSLLIKEGIDRLEVWVVNDGSKDHSSEIAHLYAERYPNVFNVIDKSNGNYGSCVNVALPRCTGKYVKILDSDDFFDKDGLQQLIDRLDNTDSDIILTNYTLIWPDRTETQTFDYCDSAYININETCPEQFYMHAIAYRRQLFGRFEYKQTEGISYTDQEWIFYPVIHADTLQYFDLNVYQYVLGREGQTMDKAVIKKNIVAIYGLVIAMLNYLKNKKTTLPSSKIIYAENLLRIQIGLIYETELLMQKKDEMNNLLSDLEELLYDYDTQFYDIFSDLKFIKIIKYVKLYRNGMVFPNFMRHIVQLIHVCILKSKSFRDKC